MISCAIVAGALLSQLSGVVAHGGVLSYSNAGNWYWGFQPYNNPVGQTSIQRPWSSYNPIQNVSVDTLACNDDGTAIPDPLQLSATIQAGSNITAYWNVPWPHNTGPVLTYLALCPGTTCNDVNANNLEWFKIQQAGLISGPIGNGLWAAGEMIANNNSWTTTIPATIPSGAYLIRFETIALHSMPAQNYPECAQINIVGGGNVPAPASILVTFPGAYSQTDPGINIDIYSSTANSTYNYTIPGPPLYPGTGVTASSLPPPPPPSSSPSSSTTSTPTSTKATTTTSSPAGPTQTVYGQCGGTGWTGPTVCAAGSTCTVSNQYYSQCLP